MTRPGSPALYGKVAKLGEFRRSCEGEGVAPEDSARKSRAAGVGNNPDTISRVRSANAGSEDTMPLRIIPERCEAMEDDVQSASAEGGHIFNDDPFGLKPADEAEILKPQARAGPREGEPEPSAASSPCDPKNGRAA